MINTVPFIITVRVPQPHVKAALSLILCCSFGGEIRKATRYLAKWYLKLILFLVKNPDFSESFTSQLPFVDILASPAEFVHSCLSELLACQVRLGEHDSK